MRPSWITVTASLPSTVKMDPSAMPRAPTRGLAALVIEQPRVGSERAVEPHRVVEARDLELVLAIRVAVREHRGVEDGEVRRVDDDADVEQRVVGQLTVGLDPDVLARRPRPRVHPARQLGGPLVDGTLPLEPVRHVRGEAVAVLRHLLLEGRQVVRHLHVRHRVLVVRTGLHDLERRGQVEDRPAVLDPDHAPGGEALPVPDAVDLVDDRDRRVTGTQEVGVQRVHRAVGLHGAARRDQRLARDLPPEHPLAVLLGRDAAKEVHLEGFEIEQRDQVVERSSHEVPNLANPRAVRGGPGVSQRRCSRRRRGPGRRA